MLWRLLVLVWVVIGSCQAEQSETLDEKLWQQDLRSGWQAAIAPEMRYQLPAEPSIMDRIQHWQLGAGFVRQAPELMGQRSAALLDLRYMGASIWYWRAVLEYGRFNEVELRSRNNGVTLPAQQSALLVATGPGLALLRGSGQLFGGDFQPWQLGIELLVGDQFTGSSSGSYVGLGLDWQFQSVTWWGALDWRFYQVNDSLLQASGVAGGMQAGLIVGRYF